MTALAATTPIGANSLQPRYVSIFDDPASFEQKIKIASALSQTQFIPKDFRGKPEDCLVVLDMAARLELNPLAVFPDVYVIDERAAFSSKFLIALVNRSGRFSRIEFDEGRDPEVAVTFGEWSTGQGGRRERKRTSATMPNYYAIARFTELSSGKTFQSPRIDVAFAEKNGWIEKTGSKWRTMPELMVRYRSAAILIRTVCPEITMGLEWAEDVEDAREEQPARTVNAVVAEERQPTKKRGNAVKQLSAPDAEKNRQATGSVVGELSRRINASKTVDELKKVGDAVASLTLPGDALGFLRSEYALQMRALGANESPTDPAEEAVAFETSESALLNAVSNANDVDALQKIRESVELSGESGAIDSDVANKVFHAIDERAAELAF